MSKLSFMSPLSQKWQALSSKDRTALLVLVVFFVAVGGYLLVDGAHQFAKTQEQNYTKALEDYLWLHNQAPYITQSRKDIQALNQRLSELGVTAEVVVEAEQARITLEQDGANVSAMLAQLEQDGYLIQELMLQKTESGSIAAQVVVR